MNKKGGFTLVELMIIVGVLGILVSIASIAIGKASTDVKEEACFNNRLAVQAAEEMYFAKYDNHTTEYLGGFQINTLSQIALAYFPNNTHFCKCPDNNTYYYWSEMDENGEAYVICSFHNPDGTTPNPSTSASATPTATPTPTPSDTTSPTPTPTPTPIPNQAPIAVGDSYVIIENNNGTFSVMENDSDPESDEISINAQSDITSPSHGSATLIGNDIIYSPNADYFGNDSFTYRIYDGELYSTYASITIEITDVNQKPIAQDDSYTTDYETILNVSKTLGVLANDFDPEGQTLTATMVAPPSVGGSVVMSSDGSFIFTPNSSEPGEISFTYKADDGVSHDGATVTITITAPPPPYLPTLTDSELLAFLKVYGLDSNVDNIDRDGRGGGVKDALVGTNSNGVVRARGNDDYIYIPNGDARVYGGWGVDILVLDGVPSDFSIVGNNITNNRTGDVIVVDRISSILFVDSDGNVQWYDF